MVKLTNDLLKNAAAEKGKRLELRDDQEPGLIFRVTDKGVRTWSIRYRNAAGEQRRKQIGPYPSVSLAKAREEARKIKGTVASGSDVVAVERLSKAEEKRKRLSTLGGLADAYFNDAALGTHRANAKAKRESTIAEEKRIYEKLVKPEFGAEPLTSISHAAIQAFVTKQSRKAKSNGRHCRNIIRQMMSYAVRLGLIEVNPAHDIAVVMPAAKETVVGDEDLRAFWNACEQPQEVEDLALSRNMGVALRMAAVTLQRGGEVIGMAWSEIDRSARTWLIPAERMKGGKAHLVPLSDLAMRLLDEATPEGKVKSAYVFPSPRSKDDVPMDRRAFSRAMNRIIKALELDGATPHDLRRTGATNLTSERVGIPRFIVSQVLAHSSDTGGAAAVTGKHYDLNDYLPEKRRALDAWAALLEQIVSGKARADNVVNMARA
ncbi:tyrosine-type recombinase/integrase [Sinorhizobium fredii]|uniref:tyrosine-type recombinase/integrase n=1 Tax=Rhizobium fredii TaxID=380 RepID=UPI0005B45545|nr:site-specific integrase [Sinorhizobium fredii]